MGVSVQILTKISHVVESHASLKKTCISRSSLDDAPLREIQGKTSGIPLERLTIITRQLQCGLA